MLTHCVCQSCKSAKGVRGPAPMPEEVRSPGLFRTLERADPPLIGLNYGPGFSLANTRYSDVSAGLATVFSLL